jgi:hypothetical protein
MRLVVSALVLSLGCTCALAQEPRAARDAKIDAEAMKIQQCRNAAKSLIGLSLDVLRGRCGQWARSTVTVTARGRSEQLLYGSESAPLLYVYVDDGVVTALQEQ